MKNKRGQGMSTQTVILLILGLVVLALLIMGVTGAAGKFLPWVSKNNVQTISDACSAACSLDSQYGFCFEKRDFKSDVNIKDVTCNYLVENYLQYGFESCPSISCDVVYVKDSLEGVCDLYPGKIVQSVIDGSLQTIEC